ncbi:MAG: serine/threonine-protein kinase [Myxococcota bacterium]
MGLSPGKRVSDNLTLVRLLGRGAMGSVWLADHLALQSQVAVKFMAPAMADDETSVRRFRQEAKAAAEIRSPHVVQVFDHGRTDEDGLLYIVMELLEGESLDRRVKRLGALPVGQMLPLVTQCCKAIAKAHERGIIHRDIKPANVFLLGADDDLFVKILDFGIAKFSGEEAIDMTAAGNMVGTPAFMSPEQLFHGREIDHRGDLWSLAVVAYYAVTGVRPFSGTTLGELCVSIKRGVFAPPSQLRPELPVAVDGWFERAFHGDLELRYRTAKEMALDWERCMDASSSVLRTTPSGVADALNLTTFPGTALSTDAASSADFSGAVPPAGRGAGWRRGALMHWPFMVAACAAVVGVGAAAVVLGTARSSPDDRNPSAATEPLADAPGRSPAADPETREPAEGQDDSEAAASADARGAQAEPGPQPGRDEGGGQLGDGAPPPAPSAARRPGAGRSAASPVAPGSDAEAPGRTPSRDAPPPATSKPPPTPDTGEAGEDVRARRAAEELGI